MSRLLRIPIMLAVMIIVLVAQPYRLAGLWRNLAAVNLVAAWHQQTKESGFMPMELTLLVYADTTILPPQLIRAKNLAILAMSQDSTTLFHLGLIGYLYGDTENAVTLLKHSVESSNPRNTVTHLFIGILEESQGKHESAIEQMRQTPIVSNLTRIAKYNADRKHYKRATEQYSMALRIAEESKLSSRQLANWYTELSDTWRAQGELIESENALRKAIFLKQDDVVLYIKLARLFLEQKQAVSAIQVLESVSSGYTPEYWVALGEAYAGVGQFEKAKVAFLRAVQTPELTKRAWAFTVLANFYASQGQLNEAILSQHYAIANEPSNLWWRISLANLYLRYGDTDSALRELSLALVSQDVVAHATALSVVGDVYAYQRQYRNALDSYTSAVQLMPASEINRIVRIRLNIIRTHLNMDNRSAALLELEDVLKVDPDNIEANQLLGQTRK